MNKEDYITAIATIISDFRRRELPARLNAEHVRKWVNQFAPEEQYVVLQETLHILSRQYFKEERVDYFLKQVIGCLEREAPLETYIFVRNQTIGQSQKIIYEKIQAIYSESYGKKCNVQSENFIRSDAGYVYIDDGLYTGGRAKKDLYSLIDSLPQGATAYAFYMIAFSNGFRYWTDRITKKAMKKNITISFGCGNMFYNDRNCVSEQIDIVWPFQSSSSIKEVKDYEERLNQTGKANYIYFNEINKGNPGPFSNVENQIKVSEIFLKYGIKIANKLQGSIFRPLGITNTPSFGFGSLCATDFNISNTSPLVLWWGSIDPSQNDEKLTCWYPLLPRRNNEGLYQEVNDYEEEFSLYKYIDILKTVYHLAVKRNRKETKRSGKSVIDYSEITIDLDEIRQKRKESELLQYLNSMDMNAIKVIQTVMYLGRDYDLPQLSEEQLMEFIERKAEDPEFEIPYLAKKVDNPNEVFLEWLEDITIQKGWKTKSIEVNQIYQKMPLDEYLHNAFQILGI